MHEIWSIGSQESRRNYWHHVSENVCTKSDFGCGSAPDPGGGAFIALPRRLAVFNKAYS